MNPFKLRTSTLQAADLVAVRAVGWFRCPACPGPDVLATEPANPRRPSQAPRCERCGTFLAPVNKAASE